MYISPFHSPFKTKLFIVIAVNIIDHLFIYLSLIIAIYSFFVI